VTYKSVITMVITHHTNNRTNHPSFLKFREIPR